MDRQWRTDNRRHPICVIALARRERVQASEAWVSLANGQLECAPWGAQPLLAEKRNQITAALHVFLASDGFFDVQSTKELKDTVACVFGCGQEFETLVAAAEHSEQCDKQSGCDFADGGFSCERVANINLGTRTIFPHGAHYMAGDGVPCRCGETFPYIHKAALHLKSGCEQLNLAQGLRLLPWVRRHVLGKDAEKENVTMSTGFVTTPTHELGVS